MLHSASAAAQAGTATSDGDERSRSAQFVSPEFPSFNYCCPSALSLAKTQGKEGEKKKRGNECSLRARKKGFQLTNGRLGEGPPTFDFDRGPSHKGGMGTEGVIRENYSEEISPNE